MVSCISTPEYFASVAVHRDVILVIPDNGLSSSVTILPPAPWTPCENAMPSNANMINFFNLSTSHVMFEYSIWGAFYSYHRHRRYSTGYRLLVYPGPNQARTNACDFSNMTHINRQILYAISRTKFPPADILTSTRTTYFSVDVAIRCEHRESAPD